MKIKKVSLEEFNKLVEKLKGNMRYENPKLSPRLKNMIVQGHSGPGTSFKNEYERMLHEHYNPTFNHIVMHDIDGQTLIIPEKKK